MNYSGARQVQPCVLHVFPAFEPGGVQRRFAAIANRFDRRWRHIIVAMDGDLSCQSELDPRLDVIFPRCEMKNRDTFGNIRRCRALLHQLAPDVMVTSNWGTIEWAIANALPLTRHIHAEDGLRIDELHGQHARRVWTRRLALRRSTVVVPSHTLHDFARKIWHIPESALELVPNGVDLERFSPVERGRDEPLVIGTVARLVAEKNLGRLLAAFAMLRQRLSARLVIVGDGPLRPELERLAHELGIAADVEFTGHSATPAAAYRRFDIFALSSDSEAMPLSLLEAMACGLPVVATDVGDVLKIVPPQNKPFIVPRSPEAFANALVSLAGAPDVRRAIGAANRFRVASDYGQERMFARWAALYDGVPTLI